jgi:uncharacterized membrane protein
VTKKQKVYILLLLIIIKMNQLEKNTKKSFEKVKQDILYVLHELDNLKQNQITFLSHIKKLVRLVIKNTVYFVFK